MSKYNSFQNTKNKLSVLWNQAFGVQRTLDAQINEATKLISEQNKLKQYIEVVDSGWRVAVLEEGSPVRRSTTKGEIVPILVTVDDYVEIEIPDNFLPFLDIAVQFKSNEIISFTGYLEDHIHAYQSNNRVRVKGDTTIIFQDDLVSQVLPTRVYKEEEIEGLDDFTANPDFVKEVWNATIEYMLDGERYRIIGYVKGFELTRELGTGCDQNNNDVYKAFITDETFTGVGGNSHGEHKITDADSNSIDGVYTKIENRYTGSSGSCTLNTTELEGETSNISLNNLDKEHWLFQQGFARKEKFEDDQWSTQVWTDITPDLDANEDTGIEIISHEFEFVGYYLYYQEDGLKRFSMSLINPSANYPDSCRGTNTTYFLGSLGFNVAEYNEVTIEVNPEGFPKVVELDGRTESNENNKTIYFKMTDNASGINKYRIYIKRNVVGAVKANQLVVRTVQSYVHLYELIDFSLELAGLTCDNREIQEYGADLSDVQYKITASIKNPLYWTQNKRIELS